MLKYTVLIIWEKLGELLVILKIEVVISNLRKEVEQGVSNPQAMKGCLLLLAVSLAMGFLAALRNDSWSVFGMTMHYGIFVLFRFFK